jgi:hypothetical protein
VAAFTRLPYFTGSAWQGGPALPDPTLGWILLTASTGHPGEGPGREVIRRWTAPHDGEFSIAGKISHGETIGDGVRGRIVSSRGGLLGEYVVFHSSMATNLESVSLRRGDTIDFVVDCRGSITNDSFEWAPIVRSMQSEQPGEWNAAANFSGSQPKTTPPLTAWEKYAQVLLETNEFAFVD